LAPIVTIGARSGSSIGGLEQQGLCSAGVDGVDGFDLLVIILSCAVVVLLGGSHCDRFGGLVVLLDDFQIQDSFVDSLEVGIHVLHDLLSDGLVEPSDEHLSLEELSS